MALGLDEVVARLSLRDRPKFSAETDKAAVDVRKIGVASEETAVASTGAFGRMTTAAGAFGLAALKVAKYATLGIAVGVAGAFFEGTKSALDFQKITAQTNAVLKSTGGVANVTADDIGNLADRIESHTAYSQEAVMSTENLLLTFRAIHNETGRGNQIFDRATVSIGNMATAMGGDMHRATIMVGKALNDPTKGMAAMSRVGVTFTQSQIDSAKAMVESGRRMDAQKLILRELQKEFGGSAKAAGQTFTGSLERAKNEAMRLFREVATPVIPYFTKALGGLADLIHGPLTTGLAKVKEGIHIFSAGVKGAETGPVHDLMSFLFTAGGEVRRFWAGLTGGSLSKGARDGFYHTAQAIRGVAEDAIHLARQVLPRLVGIVKGDVIPIIRNLIRFLEPDAVRSIRTVAHYAGIVLGGAFVVLVHALHILGPVLKGVTGFMADHKTAIHAVAITVGVFVLAMKAQAIWTAAVTKATVLWSAVTKAAAFATNTLKVGVWLLNTAFAANPVGIIVVAVLALAAGLIYAYKHSETFRHIVQGAFHAVGAAATAVWHWLKSNWPYLFVILLGPFGLVVGAIIKHWDTVTAFFKAVPGVLKTIGIDIANALTEPFRGAFNLIADGWNATLGKIHFKIPGWVPHWGGKEWSMPTLGHWEAISTGGSSVPAPTAYAAGARRMHTGGTVAADQYINLQPSEEIVRLPSGTTVIPLEHPKVAEALAARAGGDSGTYVIRLEVDGKTLAETVYTHTKDKVARA
jgi:hypothetical protein